MKKKRSLCPVSSGLDIFGDKWSLVIIRDFFAGKTLYSEFLKSPEKIATNILASRLKLLEAEGIIQTSDKSTRTGKQSYELTDKGKDLYSVLDAIANWSLEHVEGTKKLINV